jgi:hypothetical protein
VLQLVAEVAETPTANTLDEGELIADFFQGWVPFVVAVFVGDD